jgi:uncharacterized protein YkwD/NADH:ubiquinone oxidoreductase subunit 6 (subunit J)
VRRAACARFVFSPAPALFHRPVVLSGGFFVQERAVNSRLMNWVDLILLLVILLSAIVGWHRGFIIGFIDLITWTGSIVMGYLFYPYTADLMAKIIKMGPWQLPVAFILTSLAARILLGIIASYIIRRVPYEANENPANKFLGILPGLVNGWLYAVLLSALLLGMPLSDRLNAEARDSRIGSRLAMQSEWASSKLSPLFDDAIKQTITSLTVKSPESGTEMVKLSFTYDKSKARPDLEAKMLELVNQERTKRGLQPLQPDPELTLVARNQSQDMFRRGYFAHINPDGKDPFDRMKDAHVEFRSAGENLALAQTMEIAHRNLMNSPGHRANILQPKFGRLGIGIMDAGYYGLMVSQEFRN